MTNPAETESTEPEDAGTDTTADGTLPESDPRDQPDTTYWEEDEDPESKIGEELTDEEIRAAFAEDDVDTSEGPLMELTDEDLSEFKPEIRGLSWHLAPSLVRLRAEVNKKWPHRDKRSDGTLGDWRHRRERSDHNPNSRHSVDAIDLDKDGLSPTTVISAARKHPSTHYIIYNRVIWTSESGFRGRRFTGNDPHTNHIHISVRQTRSAEQNTRGWLSSAPATAPKPPQPRSRYDLPAWPFGADHSGVFYPYLNKKPPFYYTIRNVQRKLYSLGYTVGSFDGRYGATTRKAVLAFQRNSGLRADGLIGYKTYSKLRAK